MKRQRQRALMELVRHEPLGSQEQIRKRLPEVESHKAGKDYVAAHREGRE